jgi:subtilisin family serine protease
MFNRRLSLFALVLASLLTPASAAPPARATTKPDPPRAPLYVEGEVLLKFQPGIGALERSNIQVEMNAYRLRTFASGAEHWRLGPGMTVDDAVRRLSRNPVVAYAEPNYLLFTGAEPNDSYFPDQWGLKNTGQLGGKVDADVDADLAWDETTGSSTILVAVLDTGVDASHEDLVANMWVNLDETYNLIDDDGNGYVDDVQGWDFLDGEDNPSPYSNNLPPGLCDVRVREHGTHVAGITGAVGNNLKGITGINWSVKIMNLRVVPGAASYGAAAVDYARIKGAHAINASWQSGGFSQTLYDAIEAAGDAGIAFVASAMNNNNDNDSAPNYPASYDLPNVLAVAATDRSDLRWSSSNYGNDSVDLGAPGADILSTVPSWPENQVYCGEPPPVGTTYKLLSGTSMAAPLVAGALALMRSLDLEPTPTVAELKCRLLTTTDPLPSLIFRTVSGGRLNARRALDSLLAGAPCIEPENFQFTATIYGSPNPQYEQINLISLPYGNVFQGPGGPEALCEALGLSNNAELAQYDSAGNRLVHGCGGSPTFELLDLKGVEIIERHPGAKQGIIEGWDVPGAQIVIEDLGAGKIGHNLFPVRYNGTAQTPEDLCDQCGLSSQAMITRFNAAGGTVQSHVCGQLPLWNLVLGEAVLIQEPNGPVTCTPQAYE